MLAILEVVFGEMRHVLRFERHLIAGICIFYLK